MPDRFAPTVALPDPALLRAARAALNWSLLEASRRARVSVGSMLAAERAGRGATRAPSTDVLNSVKLAYEEAGVSFYADEAGGRGILLSPSCPCGGSTSP